MPENSSRSKILFYLGTFLSSIGSLLLVMALPVFFMKAALSAGLLAISVGVHRFSGIAALIFLGARVDRYDAKKVILITEIVAALASGLLILGWEQKEQWGIVPFCVALGIRAFVMGAQGSSRNRLIKLLSAGNASQEATFAIWLTKATQGAHVIAAVLALVLLPKVGFSFIILVDAFTFIVSGWAAYQLPVDSGKDISAKPVNFVYGLREIFHKHRALLWQDALLSLCVSGTILFMYKLSENSSQLVIYFNLMFGACIWLASVFVYQEKQRQKKGLYWLVITLGLLLLALGPQGIFWRLSFFFLAYMGYWILYHIHTVELQVASNKESVGAVMANRSILAAILLSIGELGGAQLTELLSLKGEILTRASIAASACLFVIYSKREKTK